MDDNEGGFLIEKEKVPELLRRAANTANKVLAYFAFRLLCESKDNIKGE